MTHIDFLKDGLQIQELNNPKLKEKLKKINAKDLKDDPVISNAIENQATDVLKKLNDSKQDEEIFYKSNKVECAIIQLHLKLLGFYEGTIDGSFGSNTKESYKKYKESKNKELKNKELKNNNTSEIIEQYFGIDDKQLNKIIHSTLKELITKYKTQLDSPEGIKLSINNIRLDIIDLLRNIDKKFPETNILKGEVDNIINNFLNPESTGNHNVKFILNLALGRTLNIEETVNNGISLLKGTIGMVFDSAKNNKGKIEGYMQTMMQNPQINQILSQIPDFNKIIELIPAVAEKMDRNTFMKAIDNLFDRNKGNINIVLNAKSPKDITQEIKLDFINSINEFIHKIINKDVISVVFSKIQDMEIFKRNPITSEILNLLNTPELTDKDRVLIVRHLTGLIDLITSKDAISTDNSIKDKNSLQLREKIEIIFKDIEEILSKIPADKRAESLKVLNSLVNNTLKTSVNIDQESSDLKKIILKNKDSLEKCRDFLKSYNNGEFRETVGKGIKNVGHLWNVWQSKDEIVCQIEKIVSKFNKTPNSKEENSKRDEFIAKNLHYIIDGLIKFSEGKIKDTSGLVSFLIENKVISNNIDKGAFIKDLEEAFGVDVGGQILNVRDNVINKYNKMFTESNLSLPKVLENQVDTKIQNQVFKKYLKQLTKSFFENTEKGIDSGSQIAITKQGIQQYITEFTNEFFKSDENKKLLVDTLQSKGIKISNPEYLINSFVEFIKNPKTLQILDQIINSMITKIENSDNIINAFNQMISDFENKGINSNYISQSDKSSIINFGVEQIYNQLNTKELISIIYNNIPKEQLGKISENDLSKISNIIKNNIPKEVISDIIATILKDKDGKLKLDIQTIGSLTDSFKDPNFLLEIISKILTDKRVNTTKLRQELIKSDILAKFDKKNGENNFKLDKSNIGKVVDLFYGLTNNISEDEYLKLSEKLGIDKIFLSLGKTILEDIRTLPKEKLQQILTNNIDLLNVAISGKLDIRNSTDHMNKTYKLIDELYASFSPEKRTEIVDKLIRSNILPKLREQNSPIYHENFNQTNINNISNIVYNLLENKDKQKSSLLICEALKQNGLGQLLDIKVFNQNLGENILMILENIGKEGFNRFLKENLQTLNSLFMPGANKEIIGEKLGIKLVTYLNHEKLKIQLKGKINKAENILIDILPHIQQVVKENSKELEMIVTQANEYKNLISNGNNIDHQKAKEIKSFGENVFAIMNKLVSKLPDGYLDGKINFEGSKSKSDIMDGIKALFVNNNFGFVAGEAVSAVFTLGHSYDYGKICERYFRDGSNKENFGNFILQTIKEAKDFSQVNK